MIAIIATCVGKHYKHSAVRCAHSRLGRRRVTV